VKFFDPTVILVDAFFESFWSAVELAALLEPLSDPPLSSLSSPHALIANAAEIRATSTSQ
jgi:hypothetical protein